MHNQAYVINLSALAPPIETDSVIPATLAHIAPGVKRDWPSIIAFYELCKLHPGNPTCCYGIFDDVFNLVWLMKIYNNNTIIPDYKAGKLQTDEFLNRLLDVFEFLEGVEFGELDTLVDEIWQFKQASISLRKVNDKSQLTNKLIAKTLLEKAWAARMVFDDTTKARINHFFTEGQNADSLFIVANSNEIDVWQTLRFLRANHAAIQWLDEATLAQRITVPDEALAKGIALDQAGKVKLYLSYTHFAFKNGEVPETGMKTNNLLALLVETEKLKPSEVTMISQWQGDLTTAAEMRMGIISAKDYFPAKNTHLKHV